MQIHVENFYQNAKEIHDIVSKLQYKRETFGHEIKDFYLVPEGIDAAFSELVGKKIKLASTSGLFRKPIPFIHFENFTEKSFYVGIVALEDTNFRTYRHKDLNAYDVFKITDDVEKWIKENCFDEQKWQLISDITLMAGNLILTKPWNWHSLSDNKLVNVFYLETDDLPEDKISENLVTDLKENKD